MIFNLFRHKYRTLSDEALMPLILQRDERAFDELYARYAATVNGFFFRRTGGNETLSADLTQDVFLAVWSKTAYYQSAQHLRPWLFTIAYNLLRNQYKRLDLWQQIQDDLAQSATEETFDNTALRMDRQTFADALQQVLSQLSEAEQLLFDLRFTEDLSVPDIAAVINVPEGTVKSRLHTLTRKLRLKLQQYEHL